MKIEFTKMHGAGNDYIYVNTLKYPIDNPEACAVEWSQTHTRESAATALCSSAVGQG